MGSLDRQSVDGSHGEAVHRDWTRGFSESLDPWKTGAVYVNAIGGDVTTERKLAAFGGPAKYERLREFKGAWDPDNLFHLNHNVSPRAGRWSKAGATGVDPGL